MSDLSSILAPIREREAAATTKKVSEAAFGDVLRIIWTTYYFGADLRWHNARTGHVEDAETLMQEIEASSGDWAWLEPSNDRARLLSALDAVEALAQQWHARGEHDMAFSKVIDNEDVAMALLTNGADMVENARHIRTAVTAALREQA
jgi:hypothetical protein